jgi:hypothetical protein
VIPFHQFGFASWRSPGEERDGRAWASHTNATETQTRMYSMMAM